MDTKTKNLFSSRAFKSGSYAATLSIIAVIICFAVNMLASALPTGFRIMDLSTTGIFSLSDESKKQLLNLGADVELYYLAETGSEDMAVSTLLEKYEAASDKIKYENKDPVLYPTFSSKYDAQGAQTGSIIVASGDKSRVISPNEMYTQTPNYTTYTYDTSFNAESMITSAISYVTRTDLPKLYTLSGHGSAAISQSAADALTRKNYESAEINILSEGAIPSDASAVIIYSPEKDLSDGELAAMREYLSKGGNLLLATDFNPNIKLTNLNTLLAEFGLSSSTGIIIEGDSAQHVKNYPHYLLPSLGSSDITAPLAENGQSVILPLAFPIMTADELPDGVSVTPVLSSSVKSYLKESAFEAQTLEKESADADGPFDVAVLSEKAEGEHTGRILWYSSSGILDEVSDSLVNGSNTDLFVNSAAFLCGEEEDISVSAKPITTPVVTLPAKTVTMLMVLTIIVIPLILIICGFVIWLKRRRR